MTSGTLITDYLGRGTFAARPVTPPVQTGGTAIYYATDTAVLYVWNGTVWVNTGGATAQFNTSPGATAEAAAFASRGNVISPDSAMSITGAAVVFTTVTGASYKIGIAAFNTGTLKISGTITYSSIFTEGTGVALSNVFFNFVTPVALAADTSYIVFIVRTDATSTTSLTMTFGTGPFYSPGLFVPNTNTAYVIASLAPAIGDLWTSDGPGVYSIMLTYTLP